MFALFWAMQVLCWLSSLQVAALPVPSCGNAKRLTHFTESFYWGCNSGFGYPQAFLL